MKINKKIIKIIIVLLLLFMIGLFISNTVSATWDVPGELNKMSDKANEGGGRAGNTVTSLMGAAINIVSTVAAGIAIIMLIVLGIQYTSSGAEGKAEAKKDLTGYVIGAVLLFGTAGILKLVQMFIDANLNNI